MDFSLMDPEVFRMKSYCMLFGDDIIIVETRERINVKLEFWMQTS